MIQAIGLIAFLTIAHPAFADELLESGVDFGAGATVTSDGSAGMTVRGRAHDLDTHTIEGEVSALDDDVRARLAIAAKHWGYTQAYENNYSGNQGNVVALHGSSELFAVRDDAIVLDAANFGSILVPMGMRVRSDDDAAVLDLFASPARVFFDRDTGEASAAGVISAHGRGEVSERILFDVRGDFGAHYLDGTVVADLAAATEFELGSRKNILIRPEVAADFSGARIGGGGNPKTELQGTVTAGVAF